MATGMRVQRGVCSATGTELTLWEAGVKSSESYSNPAEILSSVLSLGKTFLAGADSVCPTTAVPCWLTETPSWAAQWFPDMHCPSLGEHDTSPLSDFSLAVDLL